MLSDFYIKNKANEGRKLRLSLPDGKPSDDWITIRSQWSDEFLTVKNKLLSEAVALRELPEAERKQHLEDMRTAMLVPLVAGWSFDEELTPENVTELLNNAPQIADKINDLAGDDAFFFGESLTDS